MKRGLFKDVNENGNVSIDLDFVKVLRACFISLFKYYDGIVPLSFAEASLNSIIMKETPLPKTCANRQGQQKQDFDK